MLPHVVLHLHMSVGPPEQPLVMAVSSLRPIMVPGLGQALETPLLSVSQHWSSVQQTAEWPLPQAGTLLGPAQCRTFR